jgi:hypothetical protein
LNKSRKILRILLFFIGSCLETEVSKQLYYIKMGNKSSVDEGVLFPVHDGKLIVDGSQFRVGIVHFPDIFFSP